MANTYPQYIFNLYFYCKEVAPEVLQAIEEYGINDFSWKNRKKWLDQLAA